MTTASTLKDAFLTAILYIENGGTLVIDSEGNRKLVRLFKRVAPAAQAADQKRVFHVLESSWATLPKEAVDFAFDAFGEVEIDPEKISTTFAEPKRRMS